MLRYVLCKPHMSLREALKSSVDGQQLSFLTPTYDSRVVGMPPLRLDYPMYMPTAFSVWGTQYGDLTCNFTIHATVGGGGRGQNWKRTE